MRVSAQYAKEHFDELLPSMDGDEIEVEREDAGTVRLTLVPKAEAPTGNRIWGIAKGQIRMSDDFNSPEMGEEMADLFEGVAHDSPEPLK